MVTATRDYKIHLRSSTAPDGRKHDKQDQFVYSLKKRIVVKAGRRGGKTVGIAKRSIKRFLKGRRQLYAAPTINQVDSFWYEVCKALREPIDANIFKKNESEHTIELTGTKQVIKAKTAWNADSLRGDYADDLYLDEFQLMNEDAWDEVGAPMLLDNNGDVVFIFTPPSLQSTGISKAQDPRHASKMFRKAMSDTSGLWEAIHFTSHDNPFISQEALILITQDMSLDAYRREIMAQDDDIEQSWLVYGKFNESLCKIKRFIIPKTWPMYSGHDFGSANPAALFIVQNPGPDEPMTSTFQKVRKGDFVVFKEYSPGAGLSTYQHVDGFKRLSEGYEVHRSVGGNQTTEDEIRQGYMSHGWPIMAPKITKVNLQLDRVIGLFELNKIYVFDDCHNLLLQVANCLWDLDEENHPINKVRDEAKYHLLACLRYIGSDFTPETVSGTKPRVRSY